MAFTQADLDVIEAALASGETSVQFSDRLVVYRSITDLLKARAAITAALGSGGGPRHALGVANKGFGQ
jgi:hypothetical protein